MMDTRKLATKGGGGGTVLARHGNNYESNWRLRPAYCSLMSCRVASRLVVG